MSESESSRSLTIAHSLSMAQAFDRSEVWVSEAFGFNKPVIDVRQPVNGILIGKGMIEVLGTQGLIQRPMPVDVTVCVINGDHKTLMSIRVRPQYSGYREATLEVSEIATVQTRIDALAASLVSALGGSVSSAPGQ